MTRDMQQGPKVKDPGSSAFQMGLPPQAVLWEGVLGKETPRTDVIRIIPQDIHMLCSTRARGRGDLRPVG